jgi:uncharacterized membrane protein
VEDAGSRGGGDDRRSDGGEGGRGPSGVRHPRHRHEAGVEFNRIVAFSDGVFAISITLLVLGLLIPKGVSDLTETLLDQETDLIAYGISFAVIGKYWLAHHRFFGALGRFDSTLMGLNLAYLAFVALIPFSSQVLGDYSDQTAAVVLYALNMVAVNAAFQAQIVYAYRRDLVSPEARELQRRFAGPANLLVVTVFVVSIPVAFASPIAATVMWLAIFLVGRWLSDRLAAASS